MYWRASSHIHSLVISFLDMAYILFRARHAPYPNLIRGYGISVGRLFRIWRACILHAFNVGEASTCMVQDCPFKRSRELPQGSDWNLTKRAETGRPCDPTY